MQIILKSDRYNVIGTSQRSYPLNQAVEVDSTELARLREDLKDVPGLQILERESKISPDDLARVDAVLLGLIGRDPEAQESLLLKSFEEFDSKLRQELKLRVLISSELPNDLKRKSDSLLASVELWDKPYAGIPT